jgi:hypothetical protein
MTISFFNSTLFEVAGSLLYSDGEILIHHAHG